MLNTTTIKNYMIFVILILITSCTENKINDKEIKKNVKNVTNDYDEDQKITKQYLPEEMQMKTSRTESENEEDYQITLKNSNLLYAELENLQVHSQKIATLYYKKLARTIIPLNLKKIIVKIEHRNGKIDKFTFTEEDINVK